MINNEYSFDNVVNYEDSEHVMSTEIKHNRSVEEVEVLTMRTCT